MGFTLCLSRLRAAPVLPRLPVVSSASQKRHRQSLCALDALEAAEVPAFLQTRTDTSQLLSEGAGQPRKKRLHLTGVNLQTSELGETNRSIGKLQFHLRF